MLSVIVPAHNEERYIEKCLSSLLNQKYKDYEIIVVNDGSTDKTEQIVKEFQKKSKRIKLLSFKQGHSAAFARNRGAEKAKGEILVFIDADQFVKKDFLSKIAKNFQNKEIEALVGKTLGASQTFIGKCYAARKWLFWLTRQNKKQILTKDKPGCILAIRKKTFLDLKGYNEAIFYREDSDFADRTKERHKVLFNPQIIIYHYDPENFEEVVRHAKWVGKGLATDIKYFGLRKDSLIRLSEIIFWPLFLFISLVSIFFWPLQILLLFMLLFPLFYTSKTWYFSKDFLHSFGFLLLSIPKSFISTYFLIKHIIKKNV
ncbi:MAG: glycosyltransferase [Candidatus Aenigmatarchaeota archaeon]